MIRLMAIVPLLAAGGFSDSPLTAGQWTEFEELTNAQRETLRDRHGLWLRVHPQDHVELEKLGLDFTRDADGRPSHQDPLVDGAGSRLREEEEQLRKAYEQELARIRARHNDRQALLDSEQKRPEYGTPAYDGGPNAKPSVAAQGTETPIVDPAAVAPGAESDSKASSTTVTTTPNTKTTTPDQGGKSKRKDS